MRCFPQKKGNGLRAGHDPFSDVFTADERIKNVISPVLDGIFLIFVKLPVISMPPGLSILRCSAIYHLVNYSDHTCGGSCKKEEKEG